MQSPFTSWSVNGIELPDISPKPSKVLSKFKFLDPWFKWLVFVRFTPPQKLRFGCANLIYFLWNIFAVILLFVYLTIIVLNFIATVDKYHIVYDVSVICYILLFVLIKLFSAWYYHKYFNYPWYTKWDSFNGDGNIRNNLIYNDDYNVYNVGCIAKHFKFIICIFIFFKLCIITIRIIHHQMSESDINWLYTADDIAREIFYFLPVYFALIVQSVICYKYHWYLLQLINNLGNMDYNQLHIQYINIYKEWKTDYNSYLKWTIQLVIISIFITVWTDIYQYNEADMFDAARDIITILLYVVGSSLLSLFSQQNNLPSSKIG